MTGIGARHWILALAVAIFAHLGLGYLLFEITLSPITGPAGGITVSLAPRGEAPGEVTASPPGQAAEAVIAAVQVQATRPPPATVEISEHRPAVSIPPVTETARQPRPRMQTTTRTGPTKKSDSSAFKPESLSTDTPPTPIAARNIASTVQQGSRRTNRKNTRAQPPETSAKRPSTAGTGANTTHQVSAASAAGMATVVAKAQPGNAQPRYPRLARRRGFHGRVVIQASVLQDGSVGRATIKQSSGHRILDEAARTAVLGWLFQPATRGGRPVDSTIDIPVTFRLRAGS